MAVEPILIDLPDELVGERIQLRPYRAGDGAQLYAAVNESREHVRLWLPWWDGHQTPEESEALVRRFDAKWRLREDLGVGIFDKETGRFLGGAGLHRIDWTIRRFEIGYWIRKSEEGKGYVTEAVRLLCELCFGKLEANRVFIRCASTNVRSAAVPNRLGFKLEGRLANEGMNPEGTLYDMLIFGMTPEMWASAS